MGEGHAAAAVLIADASGQGCHRLVLPAPSPDPAAALSQQAVANAALLGAGPLQGAVLLEAGSWRLGLGPLSDIQRALAQHNLELVGVQSRNPHTRVAAAALGLASTPGHAASVDCADRAAAEPPGAALQVHQGTLRSGDHLQVEGSVLLLGDVNPGARITAGGHVLVWGRLRGIAHAGCPNNPDARIVALQLRPLQLRIASAVARGPEGAPPPGLAEEARIVDGAIQIDPAPPIWPLSG